MSTFTKHMGVKVKNHRLGVRPGVPDMLIIVPPHRSKDGQGHLLFIEMNRRRGGVVSKEQRDWLVALTAVESPNTEAIVAKGWGEAREAVLQHLNDGPVSLF